MDNFDELMCVDRNASLPPIIFAAANPRFQSTYPGGSDHIWSADINACRHGVQSDFFEDILFVESNDIVFICGMEFEDGYPKELNPDLARKQQHFIEFLRGENARNGEALGSLASAFSGHEYACEVRATAAYIGIRDVTLNMGIGYRNTDGKYELVTFDSSEG